MMTIELPPIVKSCDLEGCQSAATHTVAIQFPDRDDETWSLCFAHQGEIKRHVVLSRPVKPPPAEAAPTVVTDPPAFGGPRVLQRTASDHVDAHESVRARTQRAGKGGWMVDTVRGDSYTRDLQAWGKVGRTKDRENDQYHEWIEVWDGTRIEVLSRLSDHQP
jgi:hypothetical protein